MKLKIVAAGIAALGLAAVAVPAPTQAQTLISATSHPLPFPWVGAIKNFFIPEVNKRLAAAGEAELKFNEQFPLPGLRGPDVLESLSDGTNHLSWVGTLFEPQKLGLLNFAFSAPFVTDNTLDQLEVFNGLYDRFPEMGAAWEANGAVFLGAQATASYELMTTFPITSMADLQGRNIMSPGPQAQWLQGTGAVLADGQAPDAFNLLQTGAIEGVILPVTNAFGLKLYEVAPHLTLVNIGAQTTGGLAMNKTAFDNLTPSAQAIVREVGREWSVAHGQEVTRRQTGALANWEGKGGQISTLSEAEKTAWLNSLPSLGKNWAEANAGNGPSVDILAAYLEDMAAKGHVALRDWTQ